MNRTENFIALVAVAVIGDITNPQGGLLLFYVGMTAFFFVRWLKCVRRQENNHD